MGIGGDSTWVWRAFLRGYNPAFMDPYDSGYSDIGLGLKDIGVVDPRWELIRKAMGYTRMFAERLGLLDIEPHPELARFGYCLANPGSKYLVYISPECPSRIWVDLSTASGIFHVEWFDPNTGEKTEDSVLGGARRSFSSPFPKDALLLIER